MCVFTDPALSRWLGVLGGTGRCTGRSDLRFLQRGLSTGEGEGAWCAGAGWRPAGGCEVEDGVRGGAENDPPDETPSEVRPTPASHRSPQWSTDRQSKRHKDLTYLKQNLRINYRGIKALRFVISQMIIISACISIKQQLGYYIGNKYHTTLPKDTVFSPIWALCFAISKYIPFCN